jgi:hypothetical protein
MLANSYLIVGPAEPSDIARAQMTQRQTIPLAWALAVANPSSRLISTHGHHYFETRVDDALKIIDRALASWNYNTYFRDTLAPVGVFRTWLANFPAENWVYVNISELVAQSPSPDRDMDELRLLPEKVARALEEIEKKDFTLFLRELRRLSYPFVTVPITGDRQRDIQILSYEVRDTKSIEAEMALQIVGVDRDSSLLMQATESIKLRGKGAGDATEEFDVEERVVLYTKDMSAAKRLLVDRMGMHILEESSDRLIVESRGNEMMVARVNAE